MKFSHIRLMPYGKFEDKEVQFCKDTNLHIIYGENEKGKSTIHASMEDLLFSVLERSQYTFKFSKVKIEGKLENKKGESISFRRRKGRKATLLNCDDQPIQENALDNFIGSIDRHTYRNMFGMDYQQLVEGGEDLIKNSDKIDNSIVRSASGLNSINEACNEFDKRATELFTKTAKTKDLNKKIEAYFTIKKEEKNFTYHAHEYNELEEKYQRLKTTIEVLNKKANDLGAQKTKLNRIKVVGPKMVRLRDRRNRLEDFKDTPIISIEKIQERKEIDKTIKLMEEEIITLNNIIEAMIIEMRELEFNDEIIKKQHEITDLRNRLEVFLAQQKVEASLEDEIAKTKREIEGDLYKINIDSLESKEVHGLNIDMFLMEEIKYAAENCEALRTELKEIENNLKHFDEELVEKNKALEKFDKLPNYEEVEKLIKFIEKNKKSKDYIENIQQEHEGLLRETSNKIQSLQLIQAKGAEIAKLELPLMETIKKYELELSKIEEAINKVKIQWQGKLKELEQLRGSLAVAGQYQEIPTEEELILKRANRDALWLEIHHNITVAKDLQCIDEKVVHQYPDAVKTADEKSDQMRRFQDLVIKKESMKKLQEDIQQYEGEIDKLKEEKQEIGKVWHREWKGILEVEPLTPKEMKEWVENVEVIKESMTKFLKLDKSLKKINKDTEIFKDRLRESCREVLSIELGDFQSLEEMIEDIKEIIGEYREKNSQRQNLMQNQGKILDKIDYYKRNYEEVGEKLEEWEISWKDLMKKISLQEDTACRTALRYIEFAGNLYKKINDYKEQKEKLRKTKVYIQDYKEKTKDLSTALQYNTANKSVNTISEELYNLLQEEKDKATLRKEKEKQLKDSQLNLKNKKSKLALDLAKLEDIKKKYNCEEETDIEIIEDASVKKQKLMEEIDTLIKDIIEHGDGRTLEELEEEIKEVDIEAIQENMKIIDGQLQDLDGEKYEKAKEFGVTEDEYIEKINGANLKFLEIKQQQEDVMVEIETLTKEYSKNIVAHKILKKAIEVYRTKNEKSLVEKTSEIFKKLTLGSFKGIKVDYEDKSDNRILVGIREDDSLVTVDCMSEGTADQLYLALRIASIINYSNKIEPMPLVLDDILMKFDDKRTKETLKVFLEIGEEIQIIYFTHHAKIKEVVADINRELNSNGIQIIDL
ncbi:MAG: AAA family ATPase [Clostridiaceae bacterium]|nr:AAA family ATPase [Clostridiaceae bacterium]